MSQYLYLSLVYLDTFRRIINYYHKKVRMFFHNVFLSNILPSFHLHFSLIPPVAGRPVALNLARPPYFLFVPLAFIFQDNIINRYCSSTVFLLLMPFILYFIHLTTVRFFAPVLTRLFLSR